MEDRVTIAVIVLSFNQREMTLRCLESLRGQSGAPFRVVVWDNGSEDGTVEAIGEAFPEMLAHRHPTNLGVAEGRNAAAELAIERFSPTHLLFLDNDMVLAPGFVEGLLQPFRDDPRIGQTQAKLRLQKDPQRLNDGGGCRIRFWRGQTIPVGFGEIDRGQYDRPAECIACGGAMMTRTDVFRELGGFDRQFGPVGPEDLDYSLRLRRAGYVALYAPQALAYHEVSHTFGGGRYSEAYARHKARNWIRFLMRHAPWHQKLAFLCISAPYLILRLIVREARAGNVVAVRGIARGLLEFWSHRGESDRATAGSTKEPAKDG